MTVARAHDGHRPRAWRRAAPPPPPPDRGADAGSIPRIDVPSAPDFWNEVLRRAQPVVLRGLFAGQPIDRLHDVDEARRALGALVLPIRENYVAFSRPAEAAAVRGRSPERASLGEYLEGASGGPLRMCIEHPTPPELRHLFEVPGLCRIPGRDLGDLRSKLFAGRAGSFANLHFDADQRHVLLHQVFGRKRFVLIEPSAAKFLNPRGNFSMLFLQNFRPDEQERFIAFVRAQHCVLAPGETLFIPALWWHYAEYREPALSFNLRLPRNRYGRFLGDAVFPDWRLQNVSTLFLDERAVDETVEAAFARLRRTVVGPHADLDAKHRAVSALLAELCEELVPDSAVGRYACHAYDRWERAAARRFYASRADAAEAPQEVR